MRKIYGLAIFVMVIGIIISSGCGRVETYGDRVMNRNMTPINDIISDQGRYDGKDVTVKGKIDIECGTGCWFILKEGAATLYIDIEPAGFAIPQKVGRNAVVEGVISVVEGKPRLTGKAVEIR
ncbi:MAG: hypothetical protein WC779_03265 [Candidatus Omnitrophota bacterium]|jgi:hypothetical protein